MRALLLATSLLLFASARACSDGPLLKAPEGFKVEVLLSAPDIGVPTALCAAPNGDLYFGESLLETANRGSEILGRIWLVKSGDPKKRIPFADTTSLVTGLELVRDKLYVVQPPDLVVFTLTADGLSKGSKDLFRDFGPAVAGMTRIDERLHGGIRMGMDGWLYVSVGDKGIPKMTRKEKGSVEVAEGRERRMSEGNHIRLEGGGVIRFRPDGSKLEIFASGTGNPADVPLDEQDRIFVRDRFDEGSSRLMYLPEGAFMGYPWACKQRPKEVLPSLHEFGAGNPCGGYVYLDDGLPQTYRGRIFHCDPDKGKVLAVKVAPDGGGFKFVDEITFLDSDRTSVKGFRPFALRPAAAGRGFYVSDLAFEGASPERKHGRIWKVTYVKDDVKSEPLGRDTDSVAALVKALDHPAHSERLRAQRALIVRGQEAVDALLKAFFPDGIKASLGGRQFREDDTVTPRGNFRPAGVRHGLWALRELGWPQWPKLAMDLSRDQDDSIIYNAIRVMGTFDRNDAALPPDTAHLFAAELTSLLDGDEHAPNRMQAALALRQVATQKWCKDIFYEMGREKDPWVLFAAKRTLQRTADWTALGPNLPPIDRWNPTQRDLLFLTLTDQYDLGAVKILTSLAKHKDAAVRHRAVAVLAGLLHERKPYAGSWWGEKPGPNPPPRDVDWAGTPAVRDALTAALKDDSATIREAAAAALK